MQRQVPDGIIISCDFCGTDWDEVRAMVEGHKGSVLCLTCLEKALADAAPADEQFDCTLCLQHRDAGFRRWTHPNPEPSEGLNADAHLCWDCIRLAAKTFHKDKEVDFRWDPSEHPRE